MKKKILIIAMEGSMHTLRWIKQLDPNVWDIHFYASHYLPSPMPWNEVPQVLVHRPSKSYTRAILEIFSFPRFYFDLFRTVPIRAAIDQFVRYTRERANNDLVRLVNTLRPDVVHTLHTQTSAYLYDALRPQLVGRPPVWVHSLWGSDLYYCAWFPENTFRIRSALSGIRYLFVEGPRDADLARKHGFQGQICGPCPAFGGMNYLWNESENFVAPSQRKEICIKGYMDSVGRFYVALKAVELNAALLLEKGITVNIFGSQNAMVLDNARLFSMKTGVPTRISDHLPYREVMAMFKRCRAAIGLSISDGLPAAYLEAMGAGAFPIQSNTSVADYWTPEGGAIFVDPNDARETAEALRRALEDDNLVDQAALLNRRQIETRLHPTMLREQINDTYQSIIQNQELPE